MNFIPLDFEGVFAITSESKSDQRGSLLRVWEKSATFAKFQIVESSYVTNKIKGTLRGMHYQLPPFQENKIVLCLSGSIYDVGIDLRPESITFMQHFALEIGENCGFVGLVIPAGFAHGYITLEDDSDLLYFMDAEYSDESSTGIVWNDPMYGVNWPFQPILISEKDQAWPLSFR
jgi:dTDP-4-dehydrorhamnose 3,5-epimerase